MSEAGEFLTPAENKLKGPTIEELTAPYSQFSEFHDRLLQLSEENDGKVLVRFTDDRDNDHLISPYALELDDTSFHTGLDSKLSTAIQFHRWKPVEIIPFDFSDTPGEGYQDKLEELPGYVRGDFAGHVRKV